MILISAKGMRLFAIGSRTIASRASLFPPVPSPSSPRSPPLSTLLALPQSLPFFPFTGGSSIEMDHSTDTSPLVFTTSGSVVLNKLV